jgi:hypothetical protein
MQIHEIQLKCSLYITLHTKTMLPARWMKKVRKSLPILSKFFHLLSATSHFVYVNICFVFHLFLYTYNIIQPNFIK